MPKLVVKGNQREGAIYRAPPVGRGYVFHHCVSEFCLLASRGRFLLLCVFYFLNDFFFFFFFILRVWVSVCLYVCAPHVCGAQGGQKRASDPLELEL